MDWAVSNPQTSPKKNQAQIMGKNLWLSSTHVDPCCPSKLKSEEPPPCDSCVIELPLLRNEGNGFWGEMEEMGENLYLSCKVLCYGEWGS